MLVLVILLGQALGLPEVESPIPDTIGLTQIFAAAGAGGVLGGVSQVCSPRPKQERMVALGGFAGFCLGAAFYCVCLLAQLIFG
jgi:hypothetical protein